MEDVCLVRRNGREVVSWPSVEEAPPALWAALAYAREILPDKNGSPTRASSRSPTVFSSTRASGPRSFVVRRLLVRPGAPDGLLDTARSSLRVHGPRHDRLRHEHGGRGRAVGSPARVRTARRYALD